MILQDCVIPVNDQSQELKPHGNAAFPCAGYAPHYRQEDGDNVPWHWHDELEVIYIEKGQMTAKVPSQTFSLKQGDILVINGNTLHYAVAAPECDLRSFVFSPALVTGSGDSAMAEKVNIFLMRSSSRLGTASAVVPGCNRPYKKRQI